jgi:ubiquinone/menaquinone biosynthesis C-methylase UbiE
LRAEIELVEKPRLRKTHAISGVRKHFLHKGKAMNDSGREISPKIARERERVHDDVLNNLTISVKGLRPKKVLDVGTGYGANLKCLARRFGKYSRIWSVDASPAVVHEIKKIMDKHQYSRHVIIKQANAEQLPFKNDQFQLVVALFLIHHLSSPKRGILEMGRVLSPGGKLIIADWRPAAGKPLALHAQGDIPSPSFVGSQLKRSGFSIRNHNRRYWYLIEAIK